jgi:hypothetical protein
MGKKTSKNGIIWAFVIAGLVALFIVIANRIAPFTIDNDNIYLKTVVSGEMTGTPDMHSYYIGSLTGLFMSGLYSVTGNGIPWFGIVLCFDIGFVMWYVIYCIVMNCKKWYMSIIGTVFCGLVAAAVFYRYFAETQYTIVSGILGCGAVFAALMADVRKEAGENALHLIMLFIFSIMSYSMRNSGFIMVFPFIGMIFVGKICDLFYYKHKGKTVHWAVFIISVIAVVASLGINYVANKATYSSAEWQTFDKYNAARVDMVDYEGYPDFETYKDVYESYGIKKSSYVALTEHYNLILDKNINEESFTALDEINKQIRKENNADLVSKMKQVFITIFRRNFLDYTDRPINVFVYFMYLAVFVIAIISKKYRCLTDLAMLFVARMFDWIYLVFMGRYPFRVTQIIYVAELFFLVGLVIKYELWNREKPLIFKKAKMSIVYMIAVLMIAVISIRFGLPVAKSAKGTVQAFNSLSVCFQELEDYLEAHPENFYFFDMTSLHYRENTLDFTESPYENYVYMGSWITNSPWYNNKLAANGIDDPGQALVARDDLYIIFQVGEGYNRDFLDDYFEEHYPGSKVEKVTEFLSSNGFVYEILTVN